mmetsp:Transcript_41989/g.111884  ORF Transcript_41989/g.111884 Transcript_41989/m.111884 type:complete len:393 (+) Transcript_41989:253-1431(+)
MQALFRPLGPGPTAHAPPLATPPAAQVAGTLFVVALVMYLLRFLTKLHHSDQALMPNAPMPAAPGSQPQSVVLAQAAESRRLDSERNRMQHDPARGLRTAGPFPDLPGSVGTVKFEYVNIEHTPDFDNSPPYHTLAEIVDHWNPDDSDNIPSPFLEELQVFNYSDPYELALAEQYRNAEVPFKIHSIPDVDGATERWTDSYLLREMESSHMHYKVEESKNNHFMYWTQKSSRVKKWTPPTKRLGSMTFKTWLKIARDGDSLGIGAEEKHYYLMTGVEAGRLVARDPNHLGQFVSTDLGMFSTTKKNFFITNVAANKGIQCRKWTAAMPARRRRSGDVCAHQLPPRALSLRIRHEGGHRRSPLRWRAQHGGHAQGCEAIHPFTSERLRAAEHH